ncbi:hypothetical protein CPT_Premi_012 [Proteus phage Premi]|uniref:Uncharacterized protein n=1 Tax=Proteus phage Premi TaxID=3097470 RepID=A0ABZ0ZXH3_9CAUD|nr:hypothetical protein CPT_Premi_012 [Proteus phage Premi]
MKKYRVVRNTYSDNSVVYSVQSKSLLFWRDEIHDTDSGVFLIKFASESQARAWIAKQQPVTLVSKEIL